MDKKKLPLSSNFEDRTGPKTAEMLNYMLFELLRQSTPPGELLKTQDHRYMLADPIFKIAHDPFKMKVSRGY